MSDHLGHIACDITFGHSPPQHELELDLVMGMTTHQERLRHFQTTKEAIFWYATLF